MGDFITDSTKGVLLLLFEIDGIVVIICDLLAGSSICLCLTLLLIRIWFCSDLNCWLLTRFGL